jgi:hypothetical protein
MLFSECPKISTPWPITLADAQCIDMSKQPQTKYLKRMKIDTMATKSLDSFVLVMGDQTDLLTLALRKKAAVRREEYVEDLHFCEACNCRTLQCHRDATICCPSCAMSKNFQDTDNSYREGMQPAITPYLYKKTNHFKDHLKRAQARESTQFSDAVLAAVRTELNKRTKDHSQVTVPEIRQVLKRLKLTNLYNHRVLLWSKISGQKPPFLTETQEAELMYIFSLVIPIWDDVKPPDRSNMLSYPYLLNKFCNLLGYTELSRHFDLLKSKDKLVGQDFMWSQICDTLGLDFEKSISM